MHSPAVMFTIVGTPIHVPQYVTQEAALTFQEPVRLQTVGVGLCLLRFCEFIGGGGNGGYYAVPGAGSGFPCPDNCYLKVKGWVRKFSISVRLGRYLIIFPESKCM